jgi:hypothetical protein
VKSVLIRSDSTAAIQRAKDTRAGPVQEEAREIKEQMEKIRKNVDIEWVEGYDGDKRNEIANREAKRARTKSQKTITTSYLTAIVLTRATRDNYPGIPSQHYMFDYPRLKKSILDSKKQAIGSTIIRRRGDCAITGSFLHRIRRMDSERY